MQERCPLCGWYGLGLGPNTYTVGFMVDGEFLEQAKFCSDSAGCRRRALKRMAELKQEQKTFMKILWRLVQNGQIKELTK